MAVMEAAFDPQWREAWTRRQVEDSLSMPNTYALLLDDKGEPLTEGSKAAGFVLVRRAPGEEELLLIGVRPESRGRGVGKRLIELFFDTARDNGADSVFLEMRANNPAASLYRACGFEPIGRRTAYYRTLDGTTLDAITFGRKL
ncbi:GNAT family N-acetyltransferase [Erythrobacter mangrovi]|uniref:GNAT family N-acetyltransferase n=2 Tax=Erythrobacter mangrovi TaxID=2739433 RepID=A0A7D4BXK9_9SPHN|nr:GNAT family N-acetyltransferase [Erythrobacter mangrovi]